MPEEILKIDADIVAIQECYYEKDFNTLFAQLKHVYPYFARKEGRGIFSPLNLHNGLVILSKFEITGVELVLHKKVADIEYWFANKATLIAHINVPNIGKMSIVNTHPTAGGDQPESGKADTGREFALLQTMNAVDKCQREGSLPILIGDFNCASDCSAGNYELIISRGYRDCYEEAKASGVLSGEDVMNSVLIFVCETLTLCADGPTCTWDPLHELNAGGPHAHCPPCRVDHVFVPKDEPRFGAVRSAGVVFTEKIVKIPLKNKATNEAHSMCTLSDHYAIVVEIDVNAIVSNVVSPLNA